MSAGRWLLLPLVGVLALGACSDDEDPGGASGSGAGAADGGLDAASGSGGRGSGGSAGSAGVAGLGGGGPSCGSCGTTRSNEACSGKFGACLGDEGCKAIRACVYGDTPGCTLGAIGAACVETCIQTHCTTADSGKLFLEAERCAFCDGDCAPLCSSYCDAFTISPDQVTCSNPIDAGSDADDAATDAPDDAATDAPDDAPVEAGSDAASD